MTSAKYQRRSRNVSITKSFLVKRMSLGVTCAHKDAEAGCSAETLSAINEISSVTFIERYIIAMCMLVYQY